jgi:hypothetical protein
MAFQLESNYKPRGDQGQAIAKLSNQSKRHHHRNPARCDHFWTTNFRRKLIDDFQCRIVCDLGY